MPELKSLSDIELLRSVWHHTFRMTTECCSRLAEDGCYTLPPLPFAYDALEPVLDAETLHLHHDCHHQAYVDGANKAADTLRRIAAGELPETLTMAATNDLAFNLSGHMLHSLYWQSLSPEAQTLPEGAFAEAVKSSFGSFEGLKKVFRTVALGVQGSGWAVLGMDKASRRLTVLGVTKHQDAMLPMFRPLLACDVWEHAYYLRYQNKRAAYVDALLPHLHWSGAAERWEHHSSCCHA